MRILRELNIKHLGVRLLFVIITLLLSSYAIGEFFGVSYPIILEINQMKN